MGSESASEPISGTIRNRAPPSLGASIFYSAHFAMDHPESLMTGKSALVRLLEHVSVLSVSFRNSSTHLLKAACN